ncbi:MAG: 2-oxoisovalerate dehydrogenase [Clostridiales bacterium GWE2_32_10]|nr:MAG: 2-oxoisovalerate dehydrogenase [Clostridiales bacterium GWE2_32_10]HBY20263.1 2-oxoisovalerate dehydrogenase [Clostridiales bacterium]
MKREIIFLIEESVDGGYEAKALGESIYTQAESYEQIKENIKDAVMCHFEEDSRPLFIRYHFVKDEVIAI